MGTSVGSAPRRAARILHVITGLDVGGAETSLQKLLATLDRSRFEPAVVSLKGHGTMAKKIARLDVPVYSARIHEPGARLAGLRELFRTVGPWAPDLIQGWMYHGRDRTVRRVKALGRRRWKKASGYHQHARVENAFFRYTSIVGDCLRARSSSGQRREAVLACNVLNRMTELGRPVSYRIGR